MDITSLRGDFDELWINDEAIMGEIHLKYGLVYDKNTYIIILRCERGKTGEKRGHGALQGEVP
jgi:hypothetical protein